MIGHGVSKFLSTVLLFVIAVAGAARSQEGSANTQTGPSFTATGRLTDDKRNPLANTLVTVEKQPKDKKIKAIQTKTDNDGNFKVTLPNQGKYQFSVQGFTTIKKGLPNKDTHWDLGQLKLAPQPGAVHQKIEVTGRVVDQNGNPVKGAKITIARDNKPLPGIEVIETNAEGSFAVRVPGPGTYAVSAEHEGYPPGRWEKTIDDQPKQNLGELQIPRTDAPPPAPEVVRPVQTKSYSITMLPGGSAAGVAQVGWVLAGVGLALSLALQILALYQRRRNRETTLSSAVDALQTSLTYLETAVQQAGRAREVAKASHKAEVKPGRTQTARKSQQEQLDQDFPVADLVDPGQEPVAEVLLSRGDGGYAPIVLGETERLSPRSLEQEYEQIRSAPHQEGPIVDFEREHRCIRLSLCNEEELEVNPNVPAQFKTSSRGWFLGVERDGWMMCFPWFSMDFSQQSRTFQKAFHFRGENHLRVTSAARLSKRGEIWILAQRGRIESTL
jgi:hypothetical protein